VLAKLGYCSAEVNPWKKISKKKITSKRLYEKILTPEEVKRWFWFVEEEAIEDNSKYQEIALMALTYFCGVRIEEVERCNWSQVEKNIHVAPKNLKPDDSQWRIAVWADQEKNKLSKVNSIPDSAKIWLARAEEHKWRDQIAHWDHKQRFKRLRRKFRETTVISVPQNCARHCFSSYHIAKYGDHSLTSFRLAHGDVSTLKSNYAVTLKPEDAEKFFNIFPSDYKLDDGHHHASTTIGEAQFTDSDWCQESKSNKRELLREFYNQQAYLTYWHTFCNQCYKMSKYEARICYDSLYNGINSEFPIPPDIKTQWDSYTDKLVADFGQKKARTG